MSYQLITTEDGSFSCFDPEHNELFHNRAGAYTEALKNYYEPSGALQILQTTNSLRLLDSCFGLGYNTFVLLNEILQEQTITGANIDILALELKPEALENIPSILSASRFSPLKAQINNIEKLAQFGSSKFELGSSKITIEICKADLREKIPLLSSSFDLIFHDPFSARKVPQLWTTDLFKHYYRLLLPHKGKVLTYSSASAVRGGLKEAGFLIFKTQAVGDKSGGTFASCDDSLPSPLKNVVFELSKEELKKLATISGIPYRDPSFTASTGEILENRQVEQREKEEQST